jgi:hypothetical protein
LIQQAYHQRKLLLLLWRGVGLQQLVVWSGQLR